MVWTELDSGFVSLLEKIRCLQSIQFNGGESRAEYRGEGQSEAKVGTGFVPRGMLQAGVSVGSLLAGVSSNCSWLGVQLPYVTPLKPSCSRLHVEDSSGHFTPVILKVWSLEWQHQHHLKPARKANSQTLPQMSEPESLEWGLTVRV